MEAGRTPSETIQWVCGDNGAFQSDGEILEFWKDLVAEGLIAEDATPDDARRASEIPLPPQPWTPPTMTAYSDMADLFVLDPIHDVDEAGWPHCRGRKRA